MCPAHSTCTPKTRAATFPNLYNIPGRFVEIHVALYNMKKKYKIFYTKGNPKVILKKMSRLYKKTYIVMLPFPSPALKIRQNEQI